LLRCQRNTTGPPQQKEQAPCGYQKEHQSREAESSINQAIKNSRTVLTTVSAGDGATDLSETLWAKTFTAGLAYRDGRLISMIEAVHDTPSY
jgi:hypothetical protein